MTLFSGGLECLLCSPHERIVFGVGQKCDNALPAQAIITESVACRTKSYRFACSTNVPYEPSCTSSVRLVALRLSCLKMMRFIFDDVSSQQLCDLENHDIPSAVERSSSQENAVNI